MPQRISVGRIVYGHGDSAGAVEPGQRFNTEDVGIDAKALARMDEQRVVRKVEDPTDAPVAPAGPTRAASEPAPVEPVRLVEDEADNASEKMASSRRHRKDEFDDV